MEKIKEFAKLAQEFCEWVEGQPLDPNEDLARAFHLTSALFSAGTHLLEPQFKEHEDAPRIRISPEKLKARFNHLPLRYYWEIYDPLERTPDQGPPEPVVGDLQDDFDDIYADLQKGLWHFVRGDTDAAVWEWRWHFSFHIGEHLLSAMRAIHSYIYQHDDETEGAVGE